MNYYYLIASLPTLSLDVPPPLGREEFGEMCAAQLASPDYAVIAALLDGETSGTPHPFLQKWNEMDTRVRNAVVRHRAARMAVDAAPFLRPTAGFDSYTDKRVAESLAHPNPLDRELALDRCRWQMLDAITGSNYFAFEVLLAYAIKLMMVIRWSHYDTTSGKQNLEAAVAVPA